MIDSTLARVQSFMPKPTTLQLMPLFLNMMFTCHHCNAERTNA